MNKELKRCIKCDLPETYETIEFDDQGVCNICNSTKHKDINVNWQERKKLLDSLVEKHRGKSDYDCIVPFSGGKDSTYQLYYLVTQYKLKPLVVRFNHLFMRPLVEENVAKTIRKLGVDMIEFTPNWKIVKKLMKESFLRKTDFCWHCHTGIYSYPMRIALMYKVPLIFWGEPQAEITAYYDYLNDEIEYEDEKKFYKLRTLGITAEDMYGMINKEDDPIDPRDLLPYTYPELSQLKELKYCSVPLGSFIPWDYKKNTEIIKKELGWKPDVLEVVPEELNPHGEKIECFMQGSRDYLKFIKRGYSRITQINAFNIRKGRISTERAKELNLKYDGMKPHSLDYLLDYLGFDEKEFNKIAASMAIPPYEHNFLNTKVSEPLKDICSCYSDNNGK